MVRALLIAVAVLVIGVAATTYLALELGQVAIVETIKPGGEPRHTHVWYVKEDETANNGGETGGRDGDQDYYMARVTLDFGAFQVSPAIGYVRNRNTTNDRRFATGRRHNAARARRLPPAGLARDGGGRPGATHAMASGRKAG